MDLVDLGVGITPRPRHMYTGRGAGRRGHGVVESSKRLLDRSRTPLSDLGSRIPLSDLGSRIPLSDLTSDPRSGAPGYHVRTHLQDPSVPGAVRQGRGAAAAVHPWHVGQRKDLLALAQPERSVGMCEQV